MKYELRLRLPAGGDRYRESRIGPLPAYRRSRRWGFVNSGVPLLPFFAAGEFFFYW